MPRSGALSQTDRGQPNPEMEEGSGPDGLFVAEDFIDSVPTHANGIRLTREARERMARASADAKNKQRQEGRVNANAERIEDLQDNLDPFSTDPGQVEARRRAMGYLDADDLSLYGQNDVLREPTEQELVAGIAHQDSPWADSRTAFDDRGESAWTGLESAYGTGATGEGMQRSADYFGDLMTDGTDAISEADYARRTTDAEQIRKANLDSALQAAEMRGEGGSGDRLLAELSGAQGSASDIYQAGMDANAMAARRRDSAAGASADIYGTMASGQDAFSGLQGDAFDRFSQEVAAGRDAHSANQNDGMQAWMGEEADRDLRTQETNANTYGDIYDRREDRQQSTDDYNVEGRNKIIAENSAKAERGLGIYANTLGQGTTQTLGEGGLNLAIEREANRSAEEDDQDMWDRAWQGISAVRGK